MIRVEDLLEIIENETIDEVEIYYKDHYDEEYTHLVDKGMKTDPTVQFQLWPYHSSVISHLSFAENDGKKQMALELIKDEETPKEKQNLLGKLREFIYNKIFRKP